MRDESGWRSVSWVLRVAMKRELGSGTGTEDCASWRDDARVADCGVKIGENRLGRKLISPTV